VLKNLLHQLKVENEKLRDQLAEEQRQKGLIPYVSVPARRGLTVENIRDLVQQQKKMMNRGPLQHPTLNNIQFTCHDFVQSVNTRFVIDDAGFLIFLLSLCLVDANVAVLDKPFCIVKVDVQQDGIMFSCLGANHALTKLTKFSMVCTSKIQQSFIVADHYIITGGTVRY